MSQPDPIPLRNRVAEWAIRSSLLAIALAHWVFVGVGLGEDDHEK